MIDYRRTRLLRHVRTVCMSAIITLVSVSVFLNIWLLIDCDYCVGHECGRSVCEAYRDNCQDMCHYGEDIDGKAIRVRSLINTSSAVPPKTVYWQRIDLKNHLEPVYVYSAFHLAPDNEVLIISKAFYNKDEQGTSFDKEFHCVFIDNNANVVDASNAKFTKFSDHYQGYETTRVTCKLSSLLMQRPSHVKLVHIHEDQAMSDPIEIVYHPERPVVSKGPEIVSKDPEIVVCVRPLYNYSKAISIKSLVEFLAYYRANGITKFVFYKESVSREVLRLLESMSDFVDVYPWTLKNGYNEETHENQVSATEDCIYRFRSSVILFIDTDEVIVPLSHRTLKELIVEEYQTNQTVALSIRNVFVCCEFNARTGKKFPRVLNQLKRQSTVWMDGKRSKVIALRPALIDRMGIHEVGSVRPPASMWDVKAVEPSRAVMYHYRTCCGVTRTPILGSLFSLKTLKDSVVVDNSVVRFSDQIIKFIDNYIDYDHG